MKTNTPLVVVVAAVAAYTAGQLAGAAGRARLGAALAAAQRKASVDALTGLANRAGLDVELTRRARRGQPYAVLLADLDGFKPVNDRYGHAAGDVVLVEVARRLTAITPVVTVPVRVAGGSVSVGASVGVAYAGAGVAACEVLRAADVAMYRAKTAGGDAVVAHDRAAGLPLVDARPRVRLRALVGAGRELRGVAA